MNLYWKAQIVATCGFAIYGANAWIQHELHLRNTVPTVATVDKIERICRIEDTQTHAIVYGDCGGRDYFNAQAYKGGKRSDLEAKATVSIMYTAPQNGSFQTGRFGLTGHDDAFYQLKAGDRLPIRVDRKDTARFTLD